MLSGILNGERVIKGNANLYKYRLPEIDLMPGKYYIIHSDSDEMTEEGIGIDFRISAKGEALYLNNTDWLSYNGRCYRSLNSGLGENEDGKWR